MTKTNYYHEEFTQEQKSVVDGIYAAVNEYCKEKGIKVAYDDRAYIPGITEIEE